jgi:hypothetical protein
MHLGEHYFGDTIKFTEDKKLYLTSQFKKVNDQYNEIEREREREKVLTAALFLPY